MSKATRQVVVANDKLKAKLQAKKETIKKIMGVTKKITKLEKERESFKPKQRELEEDIAKMASKVKIQTWEGEIVSAVDIIEDEVSFTVTNNAEYLREETAKQCELLWERVELEITKLKEKDGDK